MKWSEEDAKVVALALVRQVRSLSLEDFYKDFIENELPRLQKDWLETDLVKLLDPSMPFENMTNIEKLKIVCWDTLEEDFLPSLVVSENHFLVIRLTDPGDVSLVFAIDRNKARVIFYDSWDTDALEFEEPYSVAEKLPVEDQLPADGPVGRDAKALG